MNRPSIPWLFLNIRLCKFFLFALLIHLTHSFPTGVVTRATSQTVFPVKSRDVFIEEPTATSPKFQITGNNVHLPDDISSILSNMRTLRKPVHVFAVHITIKSDINLVGVPILALHAHSITFTRELTINLSAPLQTKPPERPVSPRGDDAGDVILFAATIVTTASKPPKFIQNGADGIAGVPGTPGAKGANGGTPSRGSCSRRRDGCITRTGSKGAPPKDGGDGGDGSDGGDGGRGGHLSIFLATAKSGASFPFSFIVEHEGGESGTQGAGGIRGEPGTPRSFSIVKRCSLRTRQVCRPHPRNPNREICSPQKFCAASTESGVQPAAAPGKPGEPGASGKRGDDGIAKTMTSFDTGESVLAIPSEDVARFAIVLHRYYNDLILSRTSRDEAIAVTETLIALGENRESDDVANLAAFASIMGRRLILKDDVFSRGRISRQVPANLQNKLDAALDLVQTVSDHISTALNTGVVTDAVLGAAGVTIPATNIGKLVDDFKTRREILKAAVLKLDEEIEDALIRVNQKLRRLVEEKKTHPLDFVSAILGVLGKGFGFNFKAASTSGASGDVAFLFNPFALLSEAFTVGKEFTEADNRGCDLDILKGLLEPTRERQDNFPNTVDLDADFSKLTGLGTVATLSKAFLSTRSAKASAQLGCLFDVGLASFSSAKAFLENAFDLMSSRVDVLNEMMTIDLEIRDLQIVAEGIQKQRDDLEALAASSATLERGHALLRMSVTFEQARAHALRILEEMADGFGFLALRRMDKEVQDVVRERLDRNGMFAFDSVSQQTVSLKSLRLAVLNRFDAVRNCFKSNLAQEHYFWDLTRESHPLLFERGIGTGPKNRSAFELSINRDCSASRSGQPHQLGEPVLSSSQAGRCSPNDDRFYSRVSGYAVEFVGADTSLLPAGLRTLTVTLRQLGAHAFRRTGTTVLSLDVEPMTIVVPLVSVEEDASGPVIYRSPCGVDQLSLRDGVLGTFRICPSPFAAYELEVETSATPSIHNYLNSATAIRIHARIASFVNADIVEPCEPPVAVGRFLKKKAGRLLSAIQTHHHHNLNVTSLRNHHLQVRTPPARAHIKASATTKPPQMADLPPGIIRKSMPVLFQDLVVISDPELIRKLSSRSDIGRPAQAKLPFIWRQYFYATKFFFPRDRSWASALQSDGMTEQSERRQHTIDSLASGFTDDQINRLEALIKGNDDHPTVGAKVTKIVAEVILPLPEGEELPDDIARASFDTLTEINQAMNPITYFKGRRARAKVESYVLKLLPKEKYPGDIVHNLGAAAHGISKAILSLQGNLTDDIASTLSKQPMIPGILRVPLTTTTLDGIFPEDNPLIPNKTMILMDIGTAAGKTKDEKFLFGAGTENRQCPFGDLFMSTANTIRNRSISG